MEPRRVAVLYEIWYPEETPRPRQPHRFGGLDAKPQEDEDDGAEVHEEVYRALKALGHRPMYAVLDGTRRSLTKLAHAPVSLVFNLTESYAGDDTMDMHVAAYLDLLGKPYTGNDARALHLGQNKILTKKILRFHQISTPDFLAVEPGESLKAADVGLEFPLIVKPVSEDGSIGIDTGSVVHDVRELRARIRYIHENFAGAALVERYVEGREFYAAIVGHDPPEALPLVELDLSRLPEHLPRIAGTEVKWWKGSDVYRLTPPGFPKNLGPALARRIQGVAVEAYRALGLRDYGRVDLRVTSEGDVYVLEVNPNPWISSACEFVMAWRESGRSYNDLIARLLELALTRSRKPR